MNEPVPPNRFSLFEAVDSVLPFYIKTLFVRSDKFDFNRIPAKGTTLKEFDLITEKPNCDAILDWLFTYAEPHRTDGMHAFHFVKPIPTNEIWNPVLTKQSFDDEAHTWDAIFKSFEARLDNSMTRTSRIYDQSAAKAGVLIVPYFNVFYEIIPEATEGTLFVHDYFLSNNPFIVPRNIVPVTRQISIALPGGERFDFRRCINDEIEIPALNLPGTIVYDDNTTGAKGSFTPGQTIPATDPFPSWVAYAKRYHPVDINGGLFGMIRTTVYPPAEPEPTILKA